MTLEQLVTAAENVDFQLYTIAEIDHGIPRELCARTANSCQNSYSVAKAFTMTAIGILQDRGLLRITDRIFPLFADQFPAGYDPKWEQITIEHALTHRIGFDKGFLDIDVEDISTYGTDDFLQVILRHPIAYEPGSKWVYSDAAFYLLSRVVTAVSGERLDDFLQHTLFTPLGFQEVAWSHCPKGFAMGATGLYIYTRDLAKLGQLYLDGGIWQGQRLLSQDWIDIALSRQYELSPVGSGYGKGGMLGQMLYVNPTAGRVLAWHGCDWGEGAGKFTGLVLSNN